MNAMQLLSHFDRICEAPDAIPRLRRFILDLAILGKLVMQDQKEEPASELLKRIQCNKAIAGFGRQPKKLQSSGGSSPFGIPASWEWTRLGTIADKLTDGSHNPPNDAGKGFPMLSSQNVLEGSVSFNNPSRYLSDADFKLEDARTRITTGDVLLTIVGSIGRSAVVPHHAPKFALQRSVAVIRTQLLPDFLSLQLRSPTVKMYFDEHGKGTAQKGIYLGKLAECPISVPPLAEQHRIVAKVEELMALCDRLETAQAERESRRDRLVASSLHWLNNGADPDAFRKHARFYFNHLPCLTMKSQHIQQLRQTILNLAVRGKLVPQDPHDESASVLLKRISAEKTKLAKEGKRKRDLELAPVDDMQAPFALPPSWIWTRFPELGVFGRGKSKHRPRNDRTLFDGGTHRLIQTGDVARSKGVIETYTSKYNDIGLAQSMKWPQGTLCITIAANIADSGILSFDACFPDSVVGFIPASQFPSAKYFEYFLRTAKTDLLAFAPATAQKNINLEILNAVLIPLPPLDEQQRIVAKVDELMALCDKLEAQLTTTQTESHRLLEAVLHEAIEQTA
ncbi:MAG: restriction endonuclease subunit S [Nitrospira sp.]|jgi:type I restriction enzyme S subunit|nr:restriction endonuclease subunit S [Nitrospira sp.]MBP6604512.1 restriction endonuclease subunit S [Nitrospira sp.]HQY57882.1 restriction endonuclease subunit S [Nitrospira sp.]